MSSFFELIAKREPVDCSIDHQGPDPEESAEYNARHTLKVETDEGIVAAGRFPRGGEL